MVFWQQVFVVQYCPTFQACGGVLNHRLCSVLFRHGENTADVDYSGNPWSLGPEDQDYMEHGVDSGQGRGRALLCMVYAGGGNGSRPWSGDLVVWCLSVSTLTSF